MVFLGQNIEKLFSYLQSPQVVNLQNFPKKQNYLHVRTKMPYLVIFGVEFQKTIAIFEINTLRLVKFQNLLKKQKMPKFWSKYVLFGCFWGRILKSYCHI